MASAKPAPGKRIIAVDLDQTLAHYEEGDIDRYGHQYLGPPIPEMVEQIRQALAAGDEVYVFTARISPSDDSFQQSLEATESYLSVAAWCTKYLGQLLPITNIKSRRFSEIWDDRARQIVPNAGIFASDLMEAANQ